MAVTRALHLVLAVVAAALAIRAITFAVADLTARERPEIATLFDPSHGAALAAQGDEILQTGDADLDQARRRAQAALRVEAAAAGAHRVLAEVAQRSGEEGRATEFFRLAGFAARDARAQAELFDRAAQAQNFGEAMRRLDLLLRGQPPAIAQNMMRALLPLLAEPQLRDAFVDKIASEPPWRLWAMPEIARAPDAEVVRSVLAKLDQPRSPLSVDERRPLLRRLVSDGWWSEAYDGFLRSAPEARLKEGDYLYNGDFRYGVSNLPFDWELESPPSSLAQVREERRKVLSVSFFGGRVPFQHVRHLLALPAGAYRFEGEEMAVGLANERGLQWRIFCVEDPKNALAATHALTGDVAWRPFAVDFDVPEGCSFQALRLELPYRVALEQVIRGDVAYANLQIRARPVADMSQK